MSTLLLTTALSGAIQRRAFALAGLVWSRVAIAFDSVSTGARTLDGSGKLGFLIRWAWASAAEHGHGSGSLGAVAFLLLAALFFRQLDALRKATHHSTTWSLLS